MLIRYIYVICVIMELLCPQKSVVVCVVTVNGRYTKSIENFKFVVPHRLTPMGEFHSFHLPQFFEHNFNKKRRRRSVEDPGTAHYGIIVDNRHHHIELWPNHDFLSPSVVFESRDPTQKVQDRKLRTLADKKLCHYTGHVRGHRNSRVALSTCDGLAGYITLDNVRYFIEPVEEHDSNREGHHLHVVYETQPGYERYKTKNRCGTTESWEEAWKRRFRENLAKGESVVERRSAVSVHRYLETLVVADKKFLDHHKGKRDVETYIMTVMNMVADYYHDASSGNQMDVVIVRMMYLEKEEEEIDLIINQDADKTLGSFCKWQQKVNPKDIENPNHHDIAVLLTRYDICADEGADCGLMGLAFVAAACTENEPCALNEDGGLQLGIVVAHEMGHVMGCSHDKEGESSCAAQDSDESFFVMAPYVHLFTTKWSTCSRGFITALFENGLGECLTDEPQTSLYQFKNALPGTVYDAEAQCELNFPGSTVCLMNQDTFCEMLLCKTNPTSCMGNDEPPADGTKCGENKWCFRKKCVEIGARPTAINGGWGEWGPFSSCSRTCGGGVSVSERDCNNPTPQYRGRYCLGDRKKVKICNTDPCPMGTPSFREVQCSEQNKEPFNGQLFHWEAYLMQKEPCVLYCTNEIRQLAKLQPRVKDGTPCRSGTKDMCISGVCRKVGCDNQVDSDAVEDICGICNGDGTQCKVVEEVYKDTGARDYKKIATIPAGSRNIQIDELGPSMNTLAISDKTEKTFYLNGDHKEELDGEKKFGDVEGVYSHPEPGKESLVIHGPLVDDLIFFVVFYRSENVGYRYKFSEAATDLGYTPHYQWELLEWSDCTAKCGGGEQTAKYDCVEDKAGKVSSNFCVGMEKPETTTKRCNEKPCKTKWKVGKWGRCRACKGRSGVRTREVECVREAQMPGADDVLVDDNQCKGPKPGTRELCNAHKKCRARQIDGVPAKMMEDVWRQTNGKFLKRRELKLDGVINPLSSGGGSNDTCDIAGMEAGAATTPKSKTKVHLDVGKVIKDRIPQQEIKLIRVPFKQSPLTKNLSDNAFETMGDSLGDNLDTGHAQISTGDKAAKMLKKLQHQNEKEEEAGKRTKGEAKMHKKGHKQAKEKHKHGKN